MRLALIRQRYNPYGGAERFVDRAISALRDSGTEISLITRQWQGSKDLTTLVCNPFYIGNVWRDWQFSRQVQGLLKQVKFDLTQTHERIPGCDIYRAGDGVHREWLKQRQQTLGYWGKLGLRLNPYHRYALAAEEALFNDSKLKAVICNSRMVKQEILGYFAIPETKLHVIYNGVDVDVFHPKLKSAHRVAVRSQLGIPLDAPVFLFVGSGFERKGLARVLQALALISEKAFLLIVGADRKLKRYQRLAHSLLKERASMVFFLGGQKEVKPYYGAADAFVLPTLYDPFPNAALEAMACGLPIITSTKSGAAELITQGENGLVEYSLDVSQLAENLKRMTHLENTSKMGQRARKSVEHLSLEKMAQQLLGLYKQLA